MEQAKSSFELVKKYTNEIAIQIKTLEKENKLSNFYFVPIKESGKKIDGAITSFENLFLERTLEMKSKLSAMALLAQSMVSKASDKPEIPLVNKKLQRVDSSSVAGGPKTEDIKDSKY